MQLWSTSAWVVQGEADYLALARPGQAGLMERPDRDPEVDSLRSLKSAVGVHGCGERSLWPTRSLQGPGAP